MTAHPLRHRRSSLLILAVSAVLATPLFQATTAAASGGGITNLASGGLCLQDPAGSRASWTQMQVSACNGGSNQDWQTIYPYEQWAYGSPPIMFRNIFSGLCLDVAHDSGSAGAAAIQYPCNIDDHAQWFDRVNDGAENWGLVSNVGTWLDDTGAGRRNGNPVQFYTPNGSNAQVWHIHFDYGQQLALHDMQGRVYSAKIVGFNQYCHGYATLNINFPNTYLDISGWLWLTYCGAGTGGSSAVYIYAYSGPNQTGTYLGYQSCTVPNWQTYTTWYTCQIDGGSAAYPGLNSV